LLLVCLFVELHRLYGDLCIGIGVYRRSMTDSTDNNSAGCAAANSMCTTIYDIRLLKPLSECRAHTIKLQVKNN